MYDPKRESLTRNRNRSGLNDWIYEQAQEAKAKAASS